MNPNLSYGDNAEDGLERDAYEAYPGEEALTWSPSYPSSFLGFEHPGSVVDYSYQGQPLEDGAQFNDGAEGYFVAHHLSTSWHPADVGMTATETTFARHEADGQAPQVPGFYAPVDGDLVTSISPLVENGLEELHLHQEALRSKQRRSSEEMPRQGTSSKARQAPGEVKSSSPSSSSQLDGGGQNHHSKNKAHGGQQPRSEGSAASVPDLTPASSHPSSMTNANPSSFTTSAAASQAQSQADGNDRGGLNPRARNRLVAIKCRAKSKAVHDDLEAMARDSETRFASLTNYVHELEEEVYLLKSELFRHTDCGDGMIQEYIDRSARAIVANKVQATVSEAVNLLEGFVPSTGC